MSWITIYIVVSAIFAETCYFCGKRGAAADRLEKASKGALVGGYLILVILGLPILVCFTLFVLYRKMTHGK